MADEMDEDWNNSAEMDESEEEPMTKININTTSKENLMNIPGIDDKTAQDIINHRKKIGKFKSLDELANIKNLKIDFINELKKQVEI